MYSLDLCLGQFWRILIRCLFYRPSIFVPLYVWSINTNTIITRSFVWIKSLGQASDTWSNSLHFFTHFTNFTSLFVINSTYCIFKHLQQCLINMYSLCIFLHDECFVYAIPWRLSCQQCKPIRHFKFIFVIITKLLFKDVSSGWGVKLATYK